MRVSVVIPLYNKADYIGRALESVLAQTRPSDEIIVVDNGSTDGSLERARECRDRRLCFCQEATRGVSAARNHGIERATGDLIAFLDADDEWRPTLLERLLGLRERYPEAGVWATSYLIRDVRGRLIKPKFRAVPFQADGGVIRDYFAAALCGQAPLSSSSVIAPKAVLEEAGAFPVGVRLGEDHDTWLRIALRHPIAWVDAEAAIYNQNLPDRACGTYYFGDYPFVRSLETTVAHHPVPPGTLRRARAFIAMMRLGMVSGNLLAGEVNRARRIVAECRHDVAARHFWYWLALRLATLLPCHWTLAAWQGWRRLRGRDSALPEPVCITLPGHEARAGGSIPRSIEDRA